MIQWITDYHSFLVTSRFLGQKQTWMVGHLGSRFRPRIEGRKSKSYGFVSNPSQTEQLCFSRLDRILN
jgi:hypothetical protein